MMQELKTRRRKICLFVIKYGVLICFLLPKALFSYFIYFTTDLGNDAFELPLPMWYVFHHIKLCFLIIFLAVYKLWLIYTNYDKSTVQVGKPIWIFSDSFYTILFDHLRKPVQWISHTISVWRVRFFTCVC